MNPCAVRVLFWLLIFSLTLFEKSALADSSNMLSLIKGLQQQMEELQQTVASQASIIQQQGDMIRELRGQKIQVVPQTGEKVTGSELPGWLQGVEFSGDFRLRYAAELESSGATSGGFSVDQDRNRFRYRLRWGFTKTFSPEWKIGLRLASGDAGSITSRNQSFDSQFTLKNIGIDRVYATYTPDWAKIGPISRFEVTAGKFENVILKDGSSELVWDSDVTPEGIYEKINFDVFKNDSVEVRGHFTAGQFIVEESNTAGTSEDAELFVYQGGFQTNVKGITNKPVKLKTAFTWYDYNEITSPGNFGSARTNFTDNGGLSAESFDVIEIYNELSVEPAGLPPVSVFFDWVKNVNENAIPSLGGGQDKGWYLGGKLGKTKGKGTWGVMGGYFWSEANSVPAIFTDSDWGNTDNRGSIWKLSYMLTDYLTFSTTAYFTANILGDSLNPDEQTRVFNTDLVWKF